MDRAITRASPVRHSSRQTDGSLPRYAHARFREGITPGDVDYDQKTTELNLNYVIRQFNARVMVFFKDTRFDAVRTDFIQVGVGPQLQI